MRAPAKSKTAPRTVRARIRKGRIVPVEALGLPEGAEVVVTVQRATISREAEEFRKLSGAWKGSVDAEKLIRRIYKARIRGSRPMSRP